jgi:hypothetical protein
MAGFLMLSILITFGASVGQVMENLRDKETPVGDAKGFHLRVYLALDAITANHTKTKSIDLEEILKLINKHVSQANIHLLITVKDEQSLTFLSNNLTKDLIGINRYQHWLHSKDQFDLGVAFSGKNYQEFQRVEFYHGLGFFEGACHAAFVIVPIKSFTSGSYICQSNRVIAREAARLILNALISPYQEPTSTSTATKSNRGPTTTRKTTKSSTTTKATTTRWSTTLESFIRTTSYRSLAPPAPQTFLPPKAYTMPTFLPELNSQLLRFNDDQTQRREVGPMNPWPITCRCPGNGECIFDIGSMSTSIHQCYTDFMKKYLALNKIDCLKRSVTHVTTVVSICGNGLKETGEECDPHRFDSESRRQCHFAQCTNPTTAKTSTTMTTDEPTSEESNDNDSNENDSNDRGDKPPKVKPNTAIYVIISVLFIAITIAVATVVVIYVQRRKKKSKRKALMMLRERVQAKKRTRP